ncbi:MAG: septum formation protein Maf [Phycisphaerae bacterium]|nr:septum formation protein Maf [Phycisphaerae bacterium]
MNDIPTTRRPETLKLILASASPRRRELLAEAGYDFEVHSPVMEEPGDLPAGIPPAAYAESLAYFKARSVAEAYPRDLVLGADTVVALGNRVLGKPADADDARRMLTELSHNRHAVITGVALVGPGERRSIASDITYVTMRPMSSREIEDYIASGEWQGKAGAYAIQETADKFIVKLEGSFTNVVGLPMELLGRLLGRKE